jgi:hypothetical protein
VSRQTFDRVAPVVYAALDFAVIMAPAIAIKVASDRGGIGGFKDLDLLLTSGLLGLGHAVVAWSRLRSEERIALRRADMWIAAFDALVVLMLGATLLLVVILGGFAEEHSIMANRGYPVAALWGGVQLVAMGLAEVTGRAVFRWLEPRSDTSDDAAQGERGAEPFAASVGARPSSS